VNRLGRGTTVAAVLLAVLVATVAAAPAPDDEDPRCHGRQARIVGTDRADVLHGTPSRDVIWGALGDDTIVGSLGNDLLCGGPGADLIHGGRGNDTVNGGAGAGDMVIGDLGDDHLNGGPGDADEVAGSLGIDTITGGPGDSDLVHGDYGYDRMDGGAGRGDIASFATDVASRKGAGVWASLHAHKAFGDGHDRLYRVESLQGSPSRDVLTGSDGPNTIEGGAGDDRIFGRRGRDTIYGDQGRDGCRGGPVRRSCGREKAPNGSAYIELVSTPGGGGGLALLGGFGRDDFTVAFDSRAKSFSVTAGAGISLGPGCARSSDDSKQALCSTGGGPARWLTADLGPGNDRLRVEGSLAAVENVRISGGSGNDIIRGGPEDDLIEGALGADRLYGGPGADGLIGSLPGPTYLYGGKNGDLLAAGGGCAGGAIVGGPGRDDASFAETQAHPGLLIISFPQHKAWIDVVRGCDPVRLSPTNEDMEGSFDEDMLIGDFGPNAMLGQPGADWFFGNGGDDVIDARDSVRDYSIQCGRGTPATRRRPATGRSAGRALTDSFDPEPFRCSFVKHGVPVKGLHGG
jgi:Ca2+-binding RTX toxin-like protein